MQQKVYHCNFRSWSFKERKIKAYKMYQLNREILHSRSDRSDGCLLSKATENSAVQVMVSFCLKPENMYKEIG